MTSPSFGPALALLLCLGLLLPLTGCAGGAQQPVPQQSAPPHRESAAPEEEKPPEKKSAAPEEEKPPEKESAQIPLKQPQQAGQEDPITATFLLGGSWDGQPAQWKSCVSDPNRECSQASLWVQDGNPVMEITLPSPAALRQLTVELGSPNVQSLTVTAPDGTLLYRQEDFLCQQDAQPPVTRRACALPGREVEGLTLTFELVDGAQPRDFSLLMLDLFHRPVTQQQQRRVAYLPASGWEQTQDFLPQLSQLTDLVLLLAANWDASGELVLREEFSHALQSLEELRRQQPQLGVWCTVNPLGELVREGTAGQTLDTPQKRQALADRLAAFCREYGLAGIDIDWEFPREEEWESFGLFLLQLKETLSQQGLGLSLALYPREVGLSPQALEAVDYVNVMAYDQFDGRGYHSSYESAQYAIDYFLGLGLGPQQLCLGIPLYGRPTDGAAQWPLLRDSGLEPWQNRQGKVFYSGATLCGDKAALAQLEGLSGVMYYHLYGDPDGEQSVILQTARWLKGE